MRRKKKPFIKRKAEQRKKDDPLKQKKAETQAVEDRGAMRERTKEWWEE